MNIDSRMVVESQLDLVNCKKELLYEGLLVFVKSIGKIFIYNNNSWLQIN